MKNNTPRGTRKIKICCVANTDAAVKFLLLSQLKFLIREDYDVYAVCSDGKWISDIEKEGIKVKAIKIKRNISPFYDLITLYRLWNYFRREKFDIVHTNNPKPGLLGQLSAKMAGIPIIINTIHGLYFDDNSSVAKRKFFIFMEKISAKCSDLIFSVSREDIDTLIKEQIAKTEKIKYIGNGIDINKFNSEKFSEEFINIKKEKLNIPREFKIIGIVARLVKEKGYLDLFESFKAVLNVFPKIILLVIGPEDLEKKDALNPKIVKDYGIEKNVIFLGERNDVDEIYPLMDIFVLPSHREGLPVSLLEAMAEKRPIVATDIRGCREEIDNDKSGILVPMKSPSKLTEAIIFLLSNNGKAVQMAEEARIKAIKEFDESLVFDRIKECYQILIKNKLKEHSSQL